MVKRLLWIFIVLCYVSLIVFAHDDTTDSIMSTFTNTNILIVLIAASLSVIYSGAIWATLAEKASRFFFVIAWLIAFAGFIHLAAGRSGDWLLLANGIGYLVFVILRGHKAIRTTKWNSLLSIIIVIYTLITFVGYFLTHDHYDIVAISTKASEIILMLLLVFELFRTYQLQSNRMSALKS